MRTLNESKNLQVISESSKDRQIRLEALKLVKQIGIPANLSGRGYVIRAICLAISDLSYEQGITKRLYQQIASENKTTVPRVERVIRYAIEVAFGRANTDLIEKVFGDTISATKGKPTNSEFICELAEEVRNKI